jgi:hypothetical protein
MPWLTSVEEVEVTLPHRRGGFKADAGVPDAPAGRSKPGLRVAAPDLHDGDDDGSSGRAVGRSYELTS